MESPKRHESNENEDQDMISNLPDVIIGRILSLLPTKDAVSTSLLSKSWLYKWTFITQLEFQDKECSSSKKISKDLFVSFVYRVLLHLNSSGIQSFSLDMSEDYEAIHVDEWISAVVSRGVKMLCVDSDQKGNLSSHSLMKYKTLEELVLYAYGCEIEVPTFAIFSSLTVLNLTGAMLVGDPSDKSGKVHLNFPVLRTYKTKSCTWLSSVKCVTLEVPLLQVVSIQVYRPSDSVDDYSYPTIKFRASRLKEFSYIGSPLPDPTVFDLSAANVASADICFGLYKEESLQEVMALSVEILKKFQNVECLKFQKWRKVLLAKDSLTGLPSFKMLSRLELGAVASEILLALLLRTPYLKTLLFQGLLQPDQELLNYGPVPECFSTTLQVVKFRSFDGSEHQLSFAKFVMENVVALKRMSFRPHWNRPNISEEVKEKLYSFKKCCSFMSLKFST
ncbi:F-box/FBD/LRR-repeat protein At3g14710-like [Lotus japonicus]|uniref:F-box/FBD/LRR-repeat protein At3g14710-like n=1 Tax=Lotus japonicus TaxID=34305 RepID=UPI00258A04EC|nr:F-box/FBD/LRR-repeat protein At3g14710-like [Lotus japonicus]